MDDYRPTPPSVAPGQQAESPWLEGWQAVSRTLQQALDGAGFDLDHRETRSVLGRRDRGRVVDVVAVDAGGRIRVTRTERLGEETLPPDLSLPSGVVVRRVAETVRTVTATTTVNSLADLLSVLGAAVSLGRQGEGSRPVHGADHPVGLDPSDRLPPPP